MRFARCLLSVSGVETPCLRLRFLPVKNCYFEIVSVRVWPSRRTRTNTDQHRERGDGRLTRFRVGWCRLGAQRAGNYASCALPLCSAPEAGTRPRAGAGRGRSKEGRAGPCPGRLWGRRRCALATRLTGGGGAGARPSCRPGQLRRGTVAGQGRQAGGTALASGGHPTRAQICARLGGGRHRRGSARARAAGETPGPCFCPPVSPASPQIANLAHRRRRQPRSIHETFFDFRALHGAG